MNKDTFFALISDKTPLAKKIKKSLIKKIKIQKNYFMELTLETMVF